MGKGARENGRACVGARSSYRAAMRPTLVLALVSALTGCVAAPHGPHAEYRTGMTPVAPPVPASGSYLLHSSGTTVAVQRAEKGQPVGFARQPDGTVAAVAPDFTFPLTRAGYAWVAVRDSTVPTPSLARRSLLTVGDTFGRLSLGLLLLAGAAAYAVASSNSHR
jgi:hypothetical protein